MVPLMPLLPLPACLSYPTLHVALSTTNWVRSEWSSLQLPFSCSSSRVFRVRLSDSLSACRRTYAALTTNLHSRRLAKATSRLDFNYNNSNFDFEPSRVREREGKKRGQENRLKSKMSYLTVQISLQSPVSVLVSVSVSVLVSGLGF